MTEQIDGSGPRAALKQEERREFRSYVWGLSSALLLTAVPFSLLHWFAIPRLSFLILIGVLALAQMVVHFRFFLHITFSQTREDLQLILFSTLLGSIMIGGTLWIMSSLTARMAMAL